MIRIFLSSIVCLVIFTSITNIEAQEEILPLKGENVKDWHANFVASSPEEILNFI